MSWNIASCVSEETTSTLRDTAVTRDAHALKVGISSKSESITCESFESFISTPDATQRDHSHQVKQEQIRLEGNFT